MPNQRGNAYALTTLCPLIRRTGEDESAAALLRDRLNDLQTNEDSPFAQVPNTYFVRLFVLDCAIYEGVPALLDVLQNQYLAFIADFHGPLEAYLEGLWAHANSSVHEIWADCLGFSRVKDAASFVGYIKKCQVTTTFYFNGSNDAPLAEQLKALYLKQEFSNFVAEHQGQGAAALQAAFQRFVARTRPSELTAPTWRAGASDLSRAVVEAT